MNGKIYNVKWGDLYVVLRVPATQRQEEQADNVRIYVPMDPNREVILRRLNRANKSS